MADKKNILLVANWGSDVGYAWWLMENFWATISEHYRKEGRHSVLIYPEITSIPVRISATDIEVLQCDFHDHSLHNLKKLHTLIRSHSITTIYLTDAPSYSFFYLVLRLFGIKDIIVHDHTPGERTAPRGIRKILKTIIQHIPYFTADHFFAVTQYVYRRFIDVACIPEQKCFTVPNGIDPIDLDATDATYARQQFDITDDRLIVITTGRASYYKGIDFFIRCANEIINTRNIRKFHFVFCGDGPDLDEFKKLCQSYHLEDVFTFAGRRTDIRELLPSCDIGFHASKGEVGYSLSILEYMSAGLATITPDSPSVCESIDDGNTGLIYKTGDLMSACDTLLRLLEQDTRKRLGENAVTSINERYNIHNTNTALIHALKKVSP